MQKTSIVFFGTHNFAVTILQGLLDDPSISVDLVITAPDKPVGRKQEMRAPAVKILAEKCGLKVEQPVSLKNFELGINLNTDQSLSPWNKVLASFHISG